MTLYFRTALAVFLAVMLSAPAARAVVVSLDGLGLTNGTVIEDVAPGFGSEGPVTLNWNPLDSSATRLLFWNGGYSGRDAAYCGSGTDCALDLTVLPGFTLTLDSFFLGGWPDTSRLISWSVLDLASNLQVAGELSAPVSGVTGAVATVGASSTTGLRILFGPDGFNGGINDITYSYSATNGATPIPLPAAGWLLLGAVAGLAGLRRTRRASRG